jgi:hypothetical protein
MCIYVYTHTHTYMHASPPELPARSPDQVHFFFSNLANHFVQLCPSTCMCVCMYVCMCVCSFLFFQPSKPLRPALSIYMYICVYVYTYAYGCNSILHLAYVCIYVRMSVSKYVCLYGLLCTYIQTFI